MRRSTVLSLLTLALSLALATPAWAGEVVDGDGYEFKLPPGFTELMSMENNGTMRFKVNKSCMPIDGVPEVKAYVAGGQMEGFLIAARMDLTRKVEKLADLGMDQSDKWQDDLPEGVTADVRPTTVGGRDAVEVTMHLEDFTGAKTMRVICVTGGDYMVMLMLMTSDEAFPNAATKWASMISSLKVEPGINKMLLFGLVGAAGLFGLMFLGRFKSRPTHDIPDYTGRFKKDGDAPTGPGFPPRDSLEVGKRPKVLASRPPMGMAEQGGMDAPPPQRAPLSSAPGGGFANDGAAAPVRTPTSPAVTRPAPQAQNSRPGLRRTRPEGGRWGN